MATKAKYKCTQIRLYNIAGIAFNYISKNQARIAHHFPIYTPAYIETLIAQISHAQSIQTKANANYFSAAQRIELGKLSKPALLRWKELQRYIRHAYHSNPAIAKVQQASTGKNFYRSATKTNPNWKNLHQMLLLGKKYLENNSTLLAPFMPASFVAQYTQATLPYINWLNNYYSNRFNQPQTTDHKITANNTLYDSVIFSLADIKCIVPRHQRTRFTFNNINRTISSIHISTPASAQS